MSQLSRIAVAAALALSGLAVQAAPVTGQGTWETTLQARDLDNDGQIDAFYDTALNLTWLRDANANGAKNWPDANDWAQDLVFGGYDDWRLPTMIDTNAPGCDLANAGSDCGYNVQTLSGGTVYSEIAHLFHETLGNKSEVDGSGAAQAGSGLTNTGDFLNMQNAIYWTGLTYVSPETDRAWYFDVSRGFQNYAGKDNEFYAMAVRVGDITAAVPEPQTPALILLALTAVAVLRRRAPR